jgi:hypothetical protein
MTGAADRRGFAPPIIGRFAAPGKEKNVQPRRLHRTRRRNAGTPRGAVYVGRPTVWSNPFQGRPGIGHARSVILYRAWLRGELSPLILGCAGFGEHEIAALGRWRQRLLERLSQLAGRDLQCWCPISSAWCHADVLIAVANAHRDRVQAHPHEGPGPSTGSAPIPPNPAPLPAAPGPPHGTNSTGTGDHQHG